jgi:hypothetical protein
VLTGASRASWQLPHQCRDVKVVSALVSGRVSSATVASIVSLQRFVVVSTQHNFSTLENLANFHR